MTSYLVTALGVCALSGVAQAGFFSFASDTNPDGPTFSSASPGQVREGAPLDLSGAVRVDLLYDADEHGPGGSTTITSTFAFTAVTLNYTVIPMGGQFIHAWRLQGNYQFIDAGGTTVLDAAFSHAVLISWSDSASLLGTSASIQDNADTDPLLTFTMGGALAGAPTQSPNFAFSLSGLTTLTGGRVPVNPAGAFGANWKSEGSWSAQAIPTPASLTLLGGAAAASRRRRR